MKAMFAVGTRGDMILLGGDSDVSLLVFEMGTKGFFYETTADEDPPRIGLPIGLWIWEGKLHRRSALGEHVFKPEGPWRRATVEEVRPFLAKEK